MCIGTGVAMETGLVASGFSLTPGFSRVKESATNVQPFQRFSRSWGKPFKRFSL
jgi:hypothetical protein